MALTSPGVEVKVVDESFYLPAAPGTVPLIVVASAENKTNGAGDGIAPGTLKANAGRVYLITSQKDLVDTFGDPLFKTDVSGNPINAGEQNEYGLQAAYSFLGVSNRAFVARADVDLSQLDASVSPPSAAPRNGTYWLDTQTTQWGIFEWDSRPVTVGGQKFVNKVPTVITDATKVDLETGGPVAAVGKVGSYAIVAVDTTTATPALTDSHPMSVWYKNTTGVWVQVGSPEWESSFTETPELAMQPHTQIPQWKTGALDAPSGSIWIKTTEPNLGSRWRVSRYNGATQAFESSVAPLYANSVTAVAALDKAGGGANILTGALYTRYDNTDSGVSFKLHRRKTTGATVVKTAKITASTFAGVAGALTTINTSSIIGTAISEPATYSGVAVSSVSGQGIGAVVEVVKIGTGTTYTSGNTTITVLDGGTGYQVGNQLKVLGSLLGGIDGIHDLTFTVSIEETAYSFTIAESLIGNSSMSAPVTVSFDITTPAAANADVVAAAINTAGLVNVDASVDSQNRLVITHELGGEIQFVNGINSPLTVLGFEQFNPATGTGIVDLYDIDGGYAASLWEPLVYVAAEDPPTSLTEAGRLWYSSIIDEVDLMVHNGSNWVGYLNEFPNADAQGPFVQASAPETQRDNTPLVTGDIWISTDDLENFPMIYKYDADLKKWLLADKADQSSENGVVFADARYNTAGENSDVAGLIEDLLVSDYLDPDAPDPVLYPAGMLLWNTRRSGFNVKEFRLNYIDVNEDNVRADDESMVDYYPHRWVTVSSNQADGSGSFGRKAQRVVVVKAMQALVNQSQQMRDEESLVFNLMACPGYPELIGELISLNYDRGLTAFIVGDTPARLTPDATSLNRWGMNLDLAVEDNDIGAASYDEYMAMFYPWGFTSDNFGNNIVVPPSHMMLRTIALNDQVAYPWFAPAGIRRGGITNATSVGYVDSQEGEFKTVALNNGQRDTLAEAKINPITFFTGAGLVNYGQKTRAKTASAMDRINVARLVVYLRRLLNQVGKPYIFEPNDSITRESVKAACESIMIELTGNRALSDFVVVCDESNNTPARVDRNELWVDIAIMPVKAIEFIYIPLRLKSPSA